MTITLQQLAMLRTMAKQAEREKAYKLLQAFHAYKQSLFAVKN